MDITNVQQSVYSKVMKDRINANKDELFQDALINQTNKTIETIPTNKTNEFTYNNIKGITPDEIEQIFESQGSKDMANNLRLATLFSEDDNLSQSLFDTVIGKPFDVGYTFLHNRYEDKSSFFLSNNLSNKSSNNSLSDLLEQSIKNKNSGEKKVTDQISDSQLKEILTTIKSFNFLSVLTTSTKDLKDKYNDDDEYSFLYNDYALQYEQLKQKYENKKYENEKILNQF